MKCVDGLCLGKGPESTAANTKVHILAIKKVVPAKSIPDVGRVLAIFPRTLGKQDSSGKYSCKHIHKVPVEVNKKNAQS